MDDLEPKKILVKWIGSGVSPNDLTLYMKDVTYFTMSKLCFVPIPNTAVVELDDPWGKFKEGSNLA